MSGVPPEVIEALDAWLEEWKPDGVEVTSEQVAQSERWARVRAYREQLVTGRGLQPLPVDKDGLVAVLRNMADVVERDDSFGGFIEYDMGLEYDLPADAYAMVKAVYRIGNSMGQGGVRMVGEVDG